MLVTALATKIGYDAAAEIAEEAHRTGRTLRDVARAKRILPMTSHWLHLATSRPVRAGTVCRVSPSGATTLDKLSRPLLERGPDANG